MSVNVIEFKEGINKAIKYLQERIASLDKTYLDGDDYYHLELFAGMYSTEDNEMTDYLDDILPDEINYAVNFEDHVYTEDILNPEKESIKDNMDDIYEILREPDYRKDYSFKLFEKEIQPLKDAFQNFINYLESRLVVNLKSTNNVMVTKTHMNGDIIDHNFDTYADTGLMIAERIIPILLDMKLIGKDVTDRRVLDAVAYDEDRIKLEELVTGEEVDEDDIVTSIICNSSVRVCCMPIYTEPFMMVIIREDIFTKEEIERIKKDILLDVDGEFSYMEYTLAEMEQEITSGKLNDVMWWKK